MSTIRRRLSQLVGFSEDSTADSDASTRALRGSNTSSGTDTDNAAGIGGSRKDSIFSATSECVSTVASSLDETSLPTPKLHNQVSPGKLKRAVSTTFRAFSNSLRSRTQIFYTTTETDGPTALQNEESSVHESFHGGKVRSPGNKGASHSPRMALKDIFASPGKSDSRNRTGLRTGPSRDSSPSPTRNSLWSSIKERASRNPNLAESLACFDSDLLASSHSLVDDSAPSLDVDIPNSSITVLQLLERSRSRNSTGNLSRLSTPLQTSDSLRPTPTENALSQTITPAALDRPHVRFLELTPKSNPTVSHSMRKSSPNPFFTSGSSITKSGTSNNEYGGYPQGEEPSAGQEARTASPNTPSMGPKSVWDQARADRESRYRALADPEAGSDLELEEVPVKAIEHRLGPLYVYLFFHVPFPSHSEKFEGQLPN